MNRKNKISGSRMAYIVTNFYTFLLTCYAVRDNGLLMKPDDEVAVELADILQKNLGKPEELPVIVTFDSFTLVTIDVAKRAMEILKDQKHDPKCLPGLDQFFYIAQSISPFLANAYYVAGNGQVPDQHEVAGAMSAIHKRVKGNRVNAIADYTHVGLVISGVAEKVIEVLA